MHINKIFITKINNDEGFFNKSYEKLSEKRKEKVDRYKFLKDKILSATAELLLKYALNKIGINEFEYTYNEKGKPYLLSNPKVYFNLSHSGEYVICAISSDEVGCDIEKIEEFKPEIAKRYFHKCEYENILKGSAKELQKDLFYRFWTLKESFVKNLGQGLNIGLDTFEIILENEISVLQNFNKNKYYFKEIEVSKDYKCAICSMYDTIEAETVSCKVL